MVGVISCNLQDMADNGKYFWVLKWRLNEGLTERHKSSKQEGAHKHQAGRNHAQADIDPTKVPLWLMTHKVIEASPRIAW